MNLINDFILEQVNEEYCKCYRESHHCKLTRKERKEIENIFLKFREYQKEEILKALIVYSLFEPDSCIKLARRKGIFRYSEGNGHASYYMMELLRYKEILLFSENTISYLEDKLDNKWMEDYFVKSEKNLKKKISEHYQRRIRKNVYGNCLETSLILELMSYLEMAFRMNIYSAHKKIINNQLSGNSLVEYSQEEVSEAISYLIYLNYEMVPIRDDRILWLDTAYVNSSNIEELILEACKRNQLIDREFMIDYLGYLIKSEKNFVGIFDPTIEMEKNIRLGFIKGQMQEELLYQNFEHMEDEMSLYNLAIRLVDEVGENLFILKDEHTIIKRYQFQFPRILLEKLFPMNESIPQLFVEEYEYVCLICKEQMISIEEFYSLQVTEHCTAVDVILFKRFITLFVIMQNYLWKNKLIDENDLELMEKSAIPTFRESELLMLLTPFLGTEEKVKQLLELMTWNGEEKLDLQYTPILKLTERYFLAADVCVVSNSFRNIIVKARSRNNQRVNSDGRFNPLERACEECFKQVAYLFNYNRGLTFEYEGMNGEIDFLAWTDSSFYIFECKNAIVPADIFELRTTFEYMEKAEQQLNFSQRALMDIEFRKKYFKNWNISDAEKAREISTCILLGNRLFSSYSMGKHPVRYIYELNMILNIGEIKSELGTWRYWKNETFSEEDLKLFLSKEDMLSKSLLEAMQEYHIYITLMKKRVEYTTFCFNSFEAAKIKDKYFPVIYKNEELRYQIESLLQNDKG